MVDANAASDPGSADPGSVALSVACLEGNVNEAVPAWPQCSRG